MTTLTVGVDLGGTKIAALLVDGDRRIRHRVVRQHGAAGYRQVLDAVLGAIGECLGAATASVTGVGVAVAGPLSPDRERVLAALNLGFEDRPLRRDLALRLGLPVVLENDANAAAYAEYRYGAGIGSRSLVLLTLGTGIGGGLVVGGHVVTGGRGAAAELGHLPLVPGGEPCGCGARGCLEQYASGSAVGERAARSVAAGAAPRIAQISAATGETVTSRHVVAAADRGDPVAAVLLAEAGEQLGRGVAMLVPALDPDVVVLAGGFAHAAGAHLLPAVERVLAASQPFAAHLAPPSVRLAACGPDAGALGAAALAQPCDGAGAAVTRSTSVTSARTAAYR